MQGRDGEEAREEEVELEGEVGDDFSPYRSGARGVRDASARGQEVESQQPARVIAVTAKSVAGGQVDISST